MPALGAPMGKKRKQVENPSKAKSESESEEAESESGEGESESGEAESESGEAESESGEEESESGDSSEEPESESGDGSEPEEIVNVDFEFFDPKQEDFHGVKALLKVYLDDTKWDLSGFVDVVLAQTTVGSVIKTVGEVTPIGVVTALNLARYGNLACLKQVREFLLKHGSGKPELLALWDHSTAKHVGLIVSERLINVPVELVTPLFDGLFDEIGWAVTDEPTQELRKSFKFKHYLVLTRVYEEILASSTRKVSQKKVKKQIEHAGVSSSQTPLVYAKAEDEIFHSLSSWSFTFPVKAEVLAARESKSLRQLRLVMAVDASKIPTFRAKLKELTDA